MTHRDSDIHILNKPIGISYGILILVCQIVYLLLPVTALSQKKYIPDIDGEYPTSVFVVTNRLIETDESGNLVYTNVVDTASPLKFLKVTFADHAWFSEPCTGLDALLHNQAPYRDWAVWVHGDGQSFLLSMKRALEIQHLHQVNLIVFAWPTQDPGKGPIGNFKNSMRISILTGQYLGELCMALQDYKDKDESRLHEENLSIFFHSLGNYTLQLAVEKGYFLGLKKDLFDNLILNAPAVNSEGHNQWIEKLDIQDRIYICYNDEDINLEGLRVLSSLGVQLGERPVEPFAGNATYFDFTYSVGSRSNTGATHSYYYALITRLSENIRELYTDLFHGRNIIIDDPGRFENTNLKQVYQIKF